jgi:short-subunit dehydrogenase
VARGPYDPAMPIPGPAPDRTAVVTGASSGIGREIARSLARRGHGVTLVARREERLRTLADELHGSQGVRTEVVAADMTDVDARRGVARAVEERGLAAHVLVNAAGLSTVGPVHRGDADAEVGMLRTDVEAVAHLCTLFLPGMVDRGAGAVLNVASTAAFQPLPGQAGYSAAKAFVLAYSQAVRAELKGTGVSVTALCPGPVETEFAESAGFEASETEALPRFMWLSAEAVAEAGVEGLDKGRAVVVPGAANLAGSVAARYTPRTLLLPVLARQHPALRRS